MSPILVALVGLMALVGCGAAPGGSEPDGASASGTDAHAHLLLLSPAAAPAGDTCVEPGRYVVNGEIVRDSANAGRLWQRAVDGTLRTQPASVAYCASIELGGRTGWRVPTVQELATLKLRPEGLAGKDSCYPSIDHAAFPDTPSAEFWTSTVRDSGDGLETGFDDGRTHPAPLDSAFHVRCVHDGAPTVNLAP